MFILVTNRKGEKILVNKNFITMIEEEILSEQKVNTRIYVGQGFSQTSFSVKESIKEIQEKENCNEHSSCKER